jgi:hypothetical protein
MDSLASDSVASRRGHSHRRVCYYHMPTFQAFHVATRVDGEDLPEYDVQVDDKEKQVSCWIPSEAGKVSTTSRSRCSVVACLLIPTVYSELFSLLVYRRVPNRSQWRCDT